LRKGAAAVRVVGKLAVTMGPKGVVSDPVVEMEANRVKTVEIQSCVEMDIGVDGM
jgi:energy-converting hydrogenase Eha subunit E